MKNKKSLIGTISVIVIVAVGILAYVLLTGEESYRTIKLSEYSGQVQLTREGIGEIDLYDNIRLQDKDEITTGENSHAYFALDDDKYVYAEENTDLKIEATGDGENSKTKIILKSGSVTSEIQKSLGEDSNYEIETPNSTMSVRGTVFRAEVKFDENGDSYTKLQVYDGTVATTLIFPDGTKSNEVLVPVNYGVDVHGDDVISEYIIKPNSDSQEEKYPLDIEELPSSALKVLLIISGHGQVPELKVTQTEIKEIYDRKVEEEKAAEKATYAVTVYRNSNVVDSKDKYKEGELVYPSTPSRQGYTFAGWYSDAALSNSISIPVKVTGNISLYPSFTPNSNTKYTVETYEQNEQKSSYELADVVVLTGTTDTTVKVPAARMEGMTYNSRMSNGSIEIAANGGAVAKVYYDRNNVAYSFNGTAYSGAYGSTVTLTAPAKTGYDFKEFNTSPLGNGDTVSQTFTLRRSLDIYPIYTPRNDVKYTVNIHIQGLGDLYPLTETKSYEGTAGATETLTPDVMTGFTLNTEISDSKVYVKADGTAIVNLYYDRNTINYTVDGKSYSAKYGATVTPPKGSKTGYTFKAFNTKKDGTGTTYGESFQLFEEVTLYSVFTAKGDVKYTVQMYKQDIYCETLYTAWELPVTYTATADTTVKLTIPSIEGMSLNTTMSNSEIYVKADGTAIANLYYDRNSIKYTVDGVEKSAPYGTEITLDPAKNDDDNYAFQGWFYENGDKVEETFTLTSSVNIHSIYKQVAADFTVIKTMEQRDGDDDDIEEVKVKGSLGEEIYFYDAVKGYEPVETGPFEIEADGSTKIYVTYKLVKITVNNYQGCGCGVAIWDTKTYYALDLLNKWSAGSDKVYATAGHLYSQLEEEGRRYNKYYLKLPVYTEIGESDEFKASTEIYSSKDSSTYHITLYLAENSGSGTVYSFTKNVRVDLNDYATKEEGYESEWYTDAGYVNKVCHIQWVGDNSSYYEKKVPNLH